MTDIVEFAAFAPFVALAGALLCGLFGRWLRAPLPGIIASLAVAAGLVLSLLALIALLARGGGSVDVTLWHFLTAGDLDVSFGFLIDNLSAFMMVIVTLVGLLIHIYSVGYMRDDRGFARYFAGLNLFVAAMLVLVMADSFLLMFIGWEGVGVCSYLLIAFWYGDRLNVNAARKAFIVNRIGDVGFLLGMFLTFHAFGTLDIATVNQAAGTFVFGAAVITVICLFYLLAACGKSAQLPLQVWLPDAMAGPTPVSALIHAATMVTAGVYLIARMAPLYAQTPLGSSAVAWIGALTALIAAFAALSQSDIKKILAYSTISQLGFMFVAVGVGAYWAGIFHVFTHAFFKALLFLAAGSVIHALKGEQAIGNMGGLGKHLPVTGVTALIGTLAIAGVPLLSGFFSKEAILASSYASELTGDSGPALYVVLLIAAGMTAAYMFRWYYRVFAGSERLSKQAKESLHESPRVMTVPLVILAAFSILAGYIGLPAFAFPNWVQSWLEPVTAAPGFAHPAVIVELLLLGLALGATAAGLALGYWIYHLREGRPVQRFNRGLLAGANRLSQLGGGFDALYQALFVGPATGTSSGASLLDRDLIDRGLAGSALGVGLLARVLITLQSGYVRAYLLAMFLGVVAFIIVVLITGVPG